MFLLGKFSPSEKLNPYFDDIWIELPDDTVTQGDIINYRTEEFFYYYSIWENFHHFGLPHSSGWINEKKWVVSFLKAFQNAFSIFESWKLKKG